MKKIAQALQEIIEELYEISSSPNVVPSNHADFASNIAFTLKVAGKNPREVAGEIVAKFNERDGDIIAEVAGGGFVNFTVKSRELWHELSANWGEKYGENNSGAGKRALVEFPSQNMAKPYSVGHLRPGTQGWTAMKLLRACGWEVITDNHLGDSGTPFGIWVVGFLHLSNPDALARGGVHELGRVYIEMKALLKAEEERGESELADEVQTWVKQLDGGEVRAVGYSEQFNKISLEHIHSVMKRLKISTDLELGEQFYVKSGLALVQKYLEEGVFERGKDGAVICELDGFDVPLLLQKSNGAALYATTDLATLVYRATEIKPDLVVYAVGAEQKFYFEQLFALSKKLGLPQENYHLYFGLIDQIGEDGKREKMSSRRGVVLLEELLDKAVERAREIVEGRDVSDEDIEKIAIGAVKFTDFMADRKTGILFDWEKIFALSGFSGPSVQYAVVRANRILSEAANFAIADYGDYDFASEKELLKALLGYPNIVAEAARDFEAHKIANFVYSLAREFNKYYDENPILKAEPSVKSARLAVLQRFTQVMSHALDILGIEIPGKM